MEQDSNPDRSNYENFHNQFNIESIVQMMDNAYTAEALTRVINVADATLSALFKYPFEDDEKQRKNIKDLEDIIDESRNRYITARRSELRAAAAALDDTAQAWGKKIMDDDFTIVKAKKKSSKMIWNILQKSRKSTKPLHVTTNSIVLRSKMFQLLPETRWMSHHPAQRQEKTPHHPRVLDEGHHNNTLLDPPPPALHPELEECPRNPANHPPEQKQPQPKPENSWRKRMNSTPPKTTAPHQNFAISEEDFPQLPTTSKQVQPPKSTKPSANNYRKINNPLEMLKDPDAQELYNVLEKFVNIAKNVPTPAERLQALFKLLN
ncbi:hypothetical protein NPIL_70011 [Nephila pilipes]|uniref:Uncharacterized protein n=1 Tax=Nephila pilipes TaxID=299642 RepID=A0A8X6NHB9_NEPPI|nr:hypothetical protein NPIL_70011 [Nephila pilipes]